MGMSFADAAIRKMRQVRLASVQAFRCFSSRPCLVPRQFLKMHAII